MKIKIIDLLNKIANGEEVPKKIEFKGKILLFKEDVKKYWDEDENKNLNDLLSIYIGDVLNDEVEIIEDNNKIEKLSNDLHIYSSEEGIDVDSIITMCKKINEIIDKLNSGDK